MHWPQVWFGPTSYDKITEGLPIRQSCAVYCYAAGVKGSLCTAEFAASQAKCTSFIILTLEGYPKLYQVARACNALQSWLPARALVQEAIEGRFEVDPSGSIIKLPVAGCPWKEHLAQLEQEQKLGDSIKFCLYEVCCDNIDFSLSVPVCHVAAFKPVMHDVRILRTVS